MADKLAIIRSMRTQSPDHPDGIYHMHTCYRQAERVPHPELVTMIAKYNGNPEADLPSFIRMGPCGNAGAGYLGPRYQPFSLDRNGRMPYFTSPLVSPQAAAARRTAQLHGERVLPESSGEPFEAHRLAARAQRLVRARSVFDTTNDWPQARDRYGNTEFGRGCFLARKLVEAGVPFVEVGQDNYDSHADNFVCHRGNMDVLDPAWSALLQDLHDRRQLENTLVVWMGEVGRTPYINNRGPRSLHPRLDDRAGRRRHSRRSGLRGHRSRWS